MDGNFVEFQQGFIVENYVGNYELVQDENGVKYIKSKEKGPSFGGHLQKKKIFEYTINEEESMAIILANLQLEDDKTVLDFCNQYGLTLSPQIIYDEGKHFQWLGIDIEPPFKEYDFIEKEEFVYFATVIKSLLTLKRWLDDDDLEITEVCAAVIFLLLFQRDTWEKILEEPKTITGVFQKFVIDLKCRIRERMNASFYIYILKEYSKKEVKKYCEINNITEYEECSNPNIVMDFYYILQLIADQDSDQIETIEEIGIIHYIESFQLTTKQRSILKKCARQILSDSISEYIVNVTPMLEINEAGEIIGKWRVRYLFEGICLELYLMLMTNERVRICANPKCRKFFPASQCRNDKKYCSTRCLNAEMKRRQRRRKKENKK